MQTEATPRVRRARRGPADHLRNALVALGGDHPIVAAHTERAWASITFEGTRHAVRLVFEGREAVEAGEGLIAALPDHEFAIPGQLVADATITAVEQTMSPGPRMLVDCEVLLLVDA